MYQQMIMYGIAGSDDMYRVVRYYKLDEAEKKDNTHQAYC